MLVTLCRAFFLPSRMSLVYDFVIKENILTYIRTNKGRRLHKDVLYCLEEISNFKETGTSIFIESTDETIFKMINFIKNSIRLISKVFPNMIINKVDPCQSGCKIPKYWKLSKNKSKRYRRNL